MQQVTESSYDQYPYPSVPLRWTHPDMLSTMSALFGLAAAPVNSCRVLEIGCSDGANIIPMAANLSDSHFTGIDLSAAHIQRGQAVSDELDLHNLILQHLDVMDVNDTFGEFDYIIAYGIFSWVPHEVQEKILQVCQRHLSPNGVAFISYNTYPGWHMRGVVRDMMLYHSSRYGDMKTRIEQSRAMLHFLASASPQVVGRLPENKAFCTILESEQQRLAKQSDSYLLHEMLEEYNEPIYFHQFMVRAAAHGLQYLSEAELTTMMPDMLPPEIVATIGQLSGDIVATEQYLDFVRNRMFRQTLLCRQEVRLERTLGRGTLCPLYLASAIIPVSEAPSIQSIEVEKFRLPSGTTVTSNNPLIKAAFLVLSQNWPFALSFNSLLSEARLHSHSNASLEADAQILEDTLLKSLAVELIELNQNPPRFCSTISGFPCANVMARLQARHEEQITNQRHELVNVDAVTRVLLTLLDGRHSHADLYTAMQEYSDNHSSDPAQAKEQISLSEMVESKLRDLARAALLVA